MPLRPIWLIARSVLIEAVRRREIYVIVLLACLIIGGVLSIDFFEIEGLSKFYREIALKVMGLATSLMVVVLAARQLPREFEARTIYPLMARPVGRATFLAGKLVGVMLAAAFCSLLFMAIFVGGTLLGGGSIPWLLFAQHVFLQMLMLLVLASLAFLLSLLMNLDAAITIGVLFYTLAAIFISMTTYLYDFLGAGGRRVIELLTWAIPQLPLFDLSEKAVHAEAWPALDATTMATLTAYALTFAGVYFALTLIQFRRRPL